MREREKAMAHRYANTSHVVVVVAGAAVVVTVFS